MKSKASTLLLNPPVVIDVGTTDTVLELTLSDGATLSLDLSVIADTFVSQLNADIQAKTSELRASLAVIDPMSTITGSLKIASDSVFVYNDTWLAIATKVTP